MNDDDFRVLNDWICSQHDSCFDCPLRRYDDCDLEPAMQEIVEIASEIEDFGNGELWCSMGKDEVENAKTVLKKYMKASVL